MAIRKTKMYRIKGSGNKTIYISDPKVWNRAKKIAIKNKISMSELIMRLLTQMNEI